MTKQYNAGTEARSQKPEARSQKPEARSQKPEARSQKLEVYVVTHKPIDFELPDYCSKIQVNAERSGQWEGYLHDNDNPDNISLKNPSYCELTGLYAMWKNSDADIQGLYHYRRYLSRKDSSHDSENWQYFVHGSDVKSLALTEEEIIRELEHNDIILASPISSEVLSVEDMFRAHCYLNDWHELRRIFEEKYPDYVSALDHVLNVHYLSQCSLFIAKRELVEKYCTWLFGLLAEFERRTSLEGYDEHYTRLYAYVTEFLLNVYVCRHNLKYKLFHRAFVIPEAPKVRENPVKHMLKKIPFLVKIVRAIRRKVKKDEPVKFGTDEKRESQDFFVTISRLMHTGSSFFVAIITPRNQAAESLPVLEQILSSLQAEAERENMIFIPQVKLSPEAPEAKKSALKESGVRIIEFA